MVRMRMMPFPFRLIVHFQILLTPCFFILISAVLFFSGKAGRRKIYIFSIRAYRFANCITKFFFDAQPYNKSFLRMTKLRYLY